MSARPAEASELHTRILRCTQEVENARSYWRHVAGAVERPTAEQAFAEYWFGARSLARVALLMANFRARYDAFPAALRTLGAWTGMDPDTRRLICHWHLQLADPLYRAFTGRYLVERHQRVPPVVSHAAVVAWIGEQGGARWGAATRIQFASKLLSAAFSAGLLRSTRDPRPVQFPRVTAAALGYLTYLLRGVDFAGTLLDNPYAASVGLIGGTLEDRLRTLPGLRFRRQGDLVEFGWLYPDLGSWAEATLRAGEKAEPQSPQSAQRDR